MTKPTIFATILFEQGLQYMDPASFQVLLEDRLSFIKAKYKGSMDAVVDHMASIDPTPNKKFAEWLTERHLKGDNVYHPDVRQSLHYFNMAKSTAHDTNIKNHTVDSMMDVAHMARVVHEQKQPATDLEKLYDKDGVTGYRIPNKETSIKEYGFGRKHSTTWCTAANGSNNAFDKYEGGKYTMHFPNGKFLQFHHSSNQCKDPSDSEIDFGSDKHYAPYKEHVRTFMHQTAETPDDHYLHESRFGVSHEKFIESLENTKIPPYGIDSTHNNIVAANASKHPLTDDQFDHIHKNLDFNVQLSQNPHLTHEQVGKLMGHMSSRRLASMPALKGEHRDHIFNTLTEDPEGAYTIDRMHHIEPHNVDNLLDRMEAKPDAGHYKDALGAIADGEKYKFSDEQIRRIHNNTPGGQFFVAKRIAHNQKLPDDLIDSAVDAYDHNIRHGFSTEYVDKFAAKNELKPHHVEKLVKSFESRSHASYTDPLTYSTAYNIPQLTKDHIDRLTNHYVNKDRVSVTPSFISKTEHIPHDHIAKILDRANIDDMTLSQYVSRKDAKSAFVEHLAKKNSIDLDNGYISDYRKLKDFPKEKFADIEHVPYVAQNLDSHPKATKEDLHNVITGLENWSEAKRSTISKKMAHRIIDHPNSNPTHFQRLLDKWGHDWIIHDVIREHAKTPPSIKRNLDNGFF